MLLLVENLKHEEIRTYLFSRFNLGSVVGHTMDVSWLSGRKLSLLLFNLKAIL